MATKELIPFAQKSESERIYDWKMIELVDAGFKLAQAEEIANSEEADWRQAIQLVGNGCPHSLATVICGAVKRNYDG
jgi:hypothetical protein